MWRSIQKRQKLHLCDLLATCGNAKPDTLSILMNMDYNKTLHYYFSFFINECRYSLYTHNHPLHSFFVQEAGKDFGDPCMAYCETKEKVVRDWNRWKQESLVH